jgi:hypothetical protein
MGRKLHLFCVPSKRPSASRHGNAELGRRPRGPWRSHSRRSQPPGPIGGRCGSHSHPRKDEQRHTSIPNAEQEVSAENSEDSRRGLELCRVQFSKGWRHGAHRSRESAFAGHRSGNFCQNSCQKCSLKTKPRIPGFLRPGWRPIAPQASRRIGGWCGWGSRHVSNGPHWL